MQIIKKYTLLYIFYTLNYHTSSTKTDRILSPWFMCLEKHKPICIIITGAFLTCIALILFRKWDAHRKEQFNLKAYFIKENYYENYVLNKIFYIDTDFKKVTIKDQNTTSLENENDKQCYFAIINNSDNMNNNDNLIIEIYKKDNNMLYIWPYGGETNTDNIVIKNILSCINTYIKDTIKAEQKEIKIELQEKHSHSNVTFLKPYHNEYDIFNPQDTPAFFSNVMQALNMENNNQDNNLANFIFAIFTLITNDIQEDHNVGKRLNSDSLLETTIVKQLSHNKELIQLIQEKNDITKTTISAAIIQNSIWKKIIFESSPYFLYMPKNMHTLLCEKKIPEGYLGTLCFKKITSTLSKKSNSRNDKNEYETFIIQDNKTKENVGFITYQLQNGINGHGYNYQQLRIENYQEKKTLFIYCFGIKPQSQNQGYGEKALQAIENLHKKNISYIYLMSGNSDFQETSAERQSKFYTKCGFTEYKTQQKKRSSQTSMFFSLYIKEVKKSEPETKIRES